MMRTAKIAQEYPFGCPRQVGETFDVVPREVDVLLRLGRIESEPGEFGYEAKQMTAAQPQNYQTRDMAARHSGHKKKAA